MLTNLIMALLVVLTASCYETATTEAEPDGNLMGPEGGRIEAAQGRVVLEFPPDAVSEPISIEVTAAASGFPSDPGLVPGTVYEFGPAGVSFGAPVELTIRYQPTDLPEGVSESTLELTHMEAGAWEDVSGSDANGGENTVTAFIDGFSLYGIRGEPAGSIELQVTTMGANPDPDGYAIEIDGQPGQSVDVNDSATIGDVPVGEHSVRLIGVAGNCVVSGDNPKAVAVAPGLTAPVEFEVMCTDVVGDLEVSVATTGDGIDPDGYTASVDGQQQQSVGTNGTVTFDGLAEGEHTLLLQDVASNCTVAGANPRTIDVPGGGSASTTFEVDCAKGSEGLIQNLSPAEYETAPLGVGDQYYIDRDFIIESLPTDLEGGLWIRTANDHKGSSAEEFITFDLLEDAVIAIGYDSRATSLPSWLQDWQTSSDAIGVSDGAASPLNVFYKPHTSGPVTLGGNSANGADGAQSMYTAVVLGDHDIGSGDLEVTVSTTGDELDPDGYTIAVDGQQSQSIAVNGTTTFNDLTEGDHTVELTGIAGNCAVSGDNPRSTNVPADGTASISFDVSCTSATGNLEVTTSTTGDDLDPDGYIVTLDGQQSQSIGVNATTTFTNLAEGGHQVEVTGIASNCTTSGDNPRNVNVSADGTASTSFEISCSTSGGDAAIVDVSFDWSTHDRRAPGSDNWPATWSDDGHQYTPWGDGGGFGGTNDDGRVSLGVGRIEGDPFDYVGFNRYGGKDSECSANIGGKAHGAPISVNGILYMWVTPKSGPTGFESFTLYRSDDKACTWSELDVRFTRDVHGVAYAGFVQFGQDNADARDEFLYTIAVEVKESDFVIQTPGEIMMLRVPADQVDDHSAYRFFAGTSAGEPQWSSNSTERQPIFEDENGVGPFNQMIRVPGVNRYVLTTEHSESFASRLTLAEAPEPWGPWSIVYYDVFFTDNAQTVFQWNFAPKWFRNNGRDFTLIFSGTGGNDSWNSVDGSFTVSQ